MKVTALATLNARLSLLASIRPLSFELGKGDQLLRNARVLLAVLPAFDSYLQALRFTTTVRAMAFIILLTALRTTAGYVIRYMYTAIALRGISRSRFTTPLDLEQLVEAAPLLPLIALVVTALMYARWFPTFTSKEELCTCVLFFTFTEAVSLVLSSRKRKLRTLVCFSVAQMIYCSPLLAVVPV